jgi:hypothetical protein
MWATVAPATTSPVPIVPTDLGTLCLYLYTTVCLLILICPYYRVPVDDTTAAICCGTECDTCSDYLLAPHVCGNCDKAYCNTCTTVTRCQGCHDNEWCDDCVDRLDITTCDETGYEVCCARTCEQCERHVSDTEMCFGCKGFHCTVSNYYETVYTCACGKKHSSTCPIKKSSCK